MTPEQRQMRARLGAHTQWANTVDRTARTATARAGFMERFDRQVDPDRVLDPAERAKRAESARTAYFLGLALKSSQARAARKTA
jgi:hypothetical protein